MDLLAIFLPNTLLSMCCFPNCGLVDVRALTRHRAKLEIKRGGYNMLSDMPNDSSSFFPYRLILLVTSSFWIYSSSS